MQTLFHAHTIASDSFLLAYTSYVWLAEQPFLLQTGCSYSQQQLQQQQLYLYIYVGTYSHGVHANILYCDIRAQFAQRYNASSVGARVSQCGSHSQSHRHVRRPFSGLRRLYSIVHLVKNGEGENWEGIKNFSIIIYRGHTWKRGANMHWL